MSLTEHFQDLSSSPHLMATGPKRISGTYQNGCFFCSFQGFDSPRVVFRRSEVDLWCWLITSELMQHPRGRGATAPPLCASSSHITDDASATLSPRSAVTVRPPATPRSAYWCPRRGVWWCRWWPRRRGLAGGWWWWPGGAARPPCRGNCWCGAPRWGSRPSRPGWPLWRRSSCWSPSEGPRSREGTGSTCKTGQTHRKSTWRRPRWFTASFQTLPSPLDAV